METATVKVKGMTCMGCVKSVKTVLEGLGGVESAEVSLEKGQATVRYDAARANPDMFRRAIEDAGYEAA